MSATDLGYTLAELRAMGPEELADTLDAEVYQTDGGAWRVGPEPSVLVDQTRRNAACDARGLTIGEFGDVPYGPEMVECPVPEAYRDWDALEDPRSEGPDLDDISMWTLGEYVLVADRPMRVVDVTQRTVTFVPPDEPEKEWSYYRSHARRKVEDGVIER